MITISVLMLLMIVAVILVILIVAFGLPLVIVLAPLILDIAVFVWLGKKIAKRRRNKKGETMG